MACTRCSVDVWSKYAPSTEHHKERDEEEEEPAEEDGLDILDELGYYEDDD